MKSILPKKIAIALGITLGLMAYLVSGCKQTATYQGSYEEYKVHILDAGYKQMNITDTLKQQNIRAVDNNLDGVYEEIYTKNAQGNKRLESLANPDSIQKIHDQIMFLYEYPQLKQRYDKIFRITPDTLIFGTNSISGFSDLNNDGVYDVAEMMGRTPGAYSLIINKENLENPETKSFIDCSNRQIVNNQEFQEKIQYLLEK